MQLQPDSISLNLFLECFLNPQPSPPFPRGFPSFHVSAHFLPIFRIPNPFHTKAEHLPGCFSVAMRKGSRKLPQSELLVVIGGQLLSLKSQRHQKPVPFSQGEASPRGGRPLGSGRQLPPQLTVGRRPLGGGGGLGGGRVWEGVGFWEGVVLVGAPGRAVPGGGGVSGTSEQLGMRPRCDPTVRTAPSHSRG